MEEGKEKQVQGDTALEHKELASGNSNSKKLSSDDEGPTTSSSSSSTKKGVFNIRETLNEEQLKKLDEFKARVFAPLTSPNPVFKEASAINAKNAKKKRNPVEPPLQRIYMDEPTEKQKAWCDDMCLCRYLRARDWDLDKAEFMIRCTLAFREDYKVDEITPADIDVQSKQGKMYFNNEFTLNGMPIIYMKIARDQGNDRVTKLKFLVWMLEQVIKAMDVSRGVEKMAWVTDFKGMGMRMSGVSNMQISLDCLHVLLDHYPERLGVAYALNPPKVFSVFWKVLKPFMNEVTLSKIKFVQGVKQYPQLFEHIPKETLEKVYGGDKDFEYNHQRWREEHGLEAGPAVTPPQAFPAVADDDSSEGFNGVIDDEDGDDDENGEVNGKGKEEQKDKKKGKKASKDKSTSEDGKAVVAAD